MVYKPFRREVCFVADKGNSSIRFIEGVHSIQGDKFVGTVKLNTKPPNWKSEGLTVVDVNTLAISESAKVFILKLDESHLAGQLVSVVDNLQSPRGLCCTPGKNSAILVADCNSVKELNLETTQIRIDATGFQRAFDITAAANGNIGVIDVSAHTVSILEKKNEDETWVVMEAIGTGTGGCADGKADSAELNEPVGKAFDRDSAIICCFGGKSHGCIKLNSQLDFAANFMSNINCK